MESTDQETVGAENFNNHFPAMIPKFHSTSPEEGGFGVLAADGGPTC